MKQLILLLIIVKLIYPWCFFSKIVEGDKIRSLAYADNNAKIAVGLQNSFNRVYEANTHLFLGEYLFSGKQANTLHFNSDATLLLAGFASSTIKKIDLTVSPYTATDLISSHGVVMEIDFNDLYTKMVTCGEDKTYQIWDVSTYTSQYTSAVFGKKILSCRFTSDNGVVLGFEDGDVKIFHPNTGSPPNYLAVATASDNSGSHVNGISVRSGTYNYVTCLQNNNVVGSTTTGAPINTGGVCKSIDYSRSLDYFAAGGNSNKVYIFNATANNNNYVQILQDASSYIKAVRFSGDGSYLMFGSQDKYVYFYTRNCKKCIRGQYYDSPTNTCIDCPSLGGCAQCSSATVCDQCIQGFYFNSTNVVCQACHITNAGCAVCLGPGHCVLCVSGYYVDTPTDTCFTCESAIAGCLACNSQTSCQICHQQYYLQAGTNTCVPCRDTIPYCLQCNSNTLCIECELGYQQTTTGQCERCQANCISCDSDLCLECSLGYYLDTNSDCVRCSDSCLACNNADYCFDCPADMYLSSGVCTLCDYPCMTCDGANCIICYPGFYFDSNACLTCPEGCTTCEDNSQCYTCVSGYYLDFAGTKLCLECFDTFSNCQTCTNETCTSCISGNFLTNTDDCELCETIHACLICNASDSCLVCTLGHYVETDNTCASCPLGCQTCQSGTDCMNCIPGYYLNGVECQPCQGNCVSCVDSTTCLSCEIGTYLSGSLCQPCKDFIDGCIACIDIFTALPKCTDCQLGNFLTVANICQLCPTHCLTCNALDNCLSCSIGYYLDFDMSCKKCRSQCSQCSDLDTCLFCQPGYYVDQNDLCSPCSDLGCLTCNAAEECLLCITGYYLTNTNQCQLCSSSILNCLRCKSDIECSYCNFGYILSADKQTCPPCSDSVTGCIDCNDDLTCNNCQTTFYVDAVTNICEPCIEGCFDCKNSAQCYRCMDMYYLDSLSSCKLCEEAITACQLCNDQNICTNCFNGYYLLNDECLVCQQVLIGCSICSDSNTCIICDSGYYLQDLDGQCKLCALMSGCQLCEDEDTCLDCESGYYLDTSGLCLLCSHTLEGCLYCNDTVTCSSCIVGYFLTTNFDCQVCTSTIPGCLFCENQNTCYECKGGYLLDSFTFRCSPCTQAGCEICDQDDSSYCVTCNSQFYKLSPGICEYCRVPIPGCIECQSSALCIHCDSGYYENGASCDLCSIAMHGCSICNSSTVCLQCKSMYFLNALDQCQQCQSTIAGCGFCSDSSTCLTCLSGYFPQANICKPCTSLTGCVFCQDQNTCLICATGYYQSNYECLPCTIINGCFSCYSSSICTSCKGGYYLVRNICQAITYSSDDSGKQKIQLKTKVLDNTTLIHYLYASDFKFNKQTDLNSITWSTEAQLSLTMNDGSELKLNIKQVTRGKNDYTLIFYTDNPLNLEQSDFETMPFARRRLQTIPNAKTSLFLTQSTMNEIMPDYNVGGPLVVDYQLDQPDFYKSYFKYYATSVYFIAGMLFVLALFIKYSIKALVTVPVSHNLGQIIPHILALKAGALILYPTYGQYVDFCSGFMSADFPWANQVLGNALGKHTDVTPHSYAVFYTNMNIGSTYFIALIAILVLALITVIVGKCCKKQQKMYSYLQFLYCFFCFGVAFAGCSAFQGAILNPIQSLSVNGFFYILGIAMYLAVVLECCYKIRQNRDKNFWKIRMLLKATLLSLSHFSPIYLLATAICLDAILIILNYKLSHYPKLFPKAWIGANVCANLALLLIIFVPFIILSLIVVVLLIIGAIVLEGYIHHHQRLMGEQQLVKHQRENETYQNVWDINFQDDDKQSNKPSDIFQEKEKDLNGNKQTIYVGDYVQNNYMPARKKKSKAQDIKEEIKKQSILKSEINKGSRKDANQAEKLEFDESQLQNFDFEEA